MHGERAALQHVDDDVGVEQEAARTIFSTSINAN
jgi:hypothetical protein